MLTFSIFNEAIFRLLEIEVTQCDWEDYSKKQALVYNYGADLFRSCNSCCPCDNVVANLPSFVIEAICLGLYHLVEVYDNKENGNDDWREVVYTHIKNNGGICVD